MVKLMVLYGKPEDASAFDAYYAGHARAAGREDPEPQALRARQGARQSDGSEAPYYYVADLSFDDPDALQAGMSSPEGQAAGGDVANFASGGVTMFVTRPELDGVHGAAYRGRLLAPVESDGRREHRPRQAVGSEHVAARLWRLSPDQASTRHRHRAQHELYVVLEGAAGCGSTTSC